MKKYKAGTFFYVDSEHYQIILNFYGIITKHDLIFCHCGYNIPQYY